MSRVLDETNTNEVVQIRSGAIGSLSLWWECALCGVRTTVTMESLSQEETFRHAITQQPYCVRCYNDAKAKTREDPYAE